MGLGLEGWDFTVGGTGLFEALLSVLDSGTAGENVLGEAAECSKREMSTNCQTHFRLGSIRYNTYRVVMIL